MNFSKRKPLNQISLELGAMLRHMIANAGAHNAELLRTSRKLLKKGGQLPNDGRAELFQTFYHMLVDLRWKVVCECTMFMVDIVPQMGEFELDQCMSLVLPRIVPNLGHESTDVRRASLRLLHVYMRYTNNLQKVLRTYVQFGLESVDRTAQKGAVLSLPLLFTEEFSNENLFPLVQALSDLLVISDTTVFYPVFLALQRLHVLVGNDSFKLYLEHVSPDARILYQKVLSRNSTANSSGRSETGNMFEHSNSEDSNSMDGPALHMDKLITCELPKPIVDSSCNAVAGSFDTATIGTMDEPQDSDFSTNSEKDRELWRYYFHKFKQHISGTCSVDRSRTARYKKSGQYPTPRQQQQQMTEHWRPSSISSSNSGDSFDRTDKAVSGSVILMDRSRTANFGKNGACVTDRQQITIEHRRPSSESSLASGDSFIQQHEGKQPKQDSLFVNRSNRALSMPVITSGPLSDISEMSNEGSSRALIINKPQLVRQESEPPSPEKMKRVAMDIEINNGNQTINQAINDREKTPMPRRNSTLNINSIDEQPQNQPQMSLSPAKEQPIDPNVRPASSHGCCSPSPTKMLEEPLSAPTTPKKSYRSRPSSPGNAPPMPNDNKLLLDSNNLRRMSTVSESMPAISLPAPSGNVQATSGNEPTDTEAKEQCENHNKDQSDEFCGKRDAQTQKDDSSEMSTTSSDRTYLNSVKPVQGKGVPVGRRRNSRQRLSRSISPMPASKSRHHHMIRTLQPAIPANANIRSILENVAKTEGSFNNPEDALKAAIAAFTQDAWTTKVEGMLAVTRLATYHPNVLQKDIHTIIGALVYEVKNLRSSVARSAIFTLGELFVRMKKQVEPDMDSMGQALLHKCGENVTFIREDIDKALTNMIREMPQSKTALTLITNGAKNMPVRRTTGFYLSQLVEQMGPNKCLMGPRDIGEHLLPAAARFVQDGSPHTRYYGRKIFSILQPHASFDKLLRKYLSPSTFRNIVGILESIKRRGIGDKPPDLPSKG